MNAAAAALDRTSGKRSPALVRGGGAAAAAAGL